MLTRLQAEQTRSILLHEKKWLQCKYGGYT